MRSILVLCLISSLFLFCISVLATPFIGTILQRRDEELNLDFPDVLDDAPLEKSLVEPTEPAELEKSEKPEKFEKPKKPERLEKPEEPEKLEKYEKLEVLEKSVHKHEGLRGMRCGAALYTRGNLVDAATQACKLMKEKKKTWGFIRYPLAYQPSLEEITSPLSSNEDEKPQGPYFLYPILQGGKVYKKLGRTGPHRIILNRECQVAGAVIKLNPRTKCQGTNCWNPFRYQHLIYKTCDLDYDR